MMSIRALSQIGHAIESWQPSTACLRARQLAVLAQRLATQDFNSLLKQQGLPTEGARQGLGVCHDPLRQERGHVLHPDGEDTGRLPPETR
jgi:hypothetical protein